MSSSPTTLLGIPAQIDLGNLTVGLATVIIAIVTFVVSVKNIRGERSQKTAELRNEWLADLRQHLATFGGAVNELAVTESKADSELIKRIAFEVTYVRLKLKKSQRTDRLSAVMYQLQGIAIRKMSNPLIDYINSICSCLKRYCRMAGMISSMICSTLQQVEDERKLSCP